jgi:hypothetical protein
LSGKNSTICVNKTEETGLREMAWENDCKRDKVKFSLSSLAYILVLFFIVVLTGEILENTWSTLG